MPELADKQLKTLKKLIETAESSLAGAREMLASLIGEDLGGSHTIAPVAGKIIEGVFDGQNMVADGKIYPVGANYASKSKLVQGDNLKLTIGDDGKFLYKQIGPVDRRNLVGSLSLKDGQYFVTAGKQEYRVLFASVTYHKASPGDQVAIAVPDGVDSQWAAIEALIG